MANITTTRFNLEIVNVQKEIEDYLSDKNVDVQALRDSDEGGFVDMIDYGRGIVSKESIEELCEQFRIQ